MPILDRSVDVDASLRFAPTSNIYDYAAYGAGFPEDPADSRDTSSIPMQKESIVKRARYASLLSLLLTGCFAHSEPPPQPLELTRARPAVAPEHCEPSGEPVKPAGNTPAPEAEGEFAIADVRGDDRFAMAGRAVFGWSSDGEQILAATTDSVLIWRASTGELERRIELGVRLYGPAQVIMSPDSKWIAVAGYLPSEKPRGKQKEEKPVGFLLRSNGSGDIKRLPGASGGLSFTPDSARLTLYRQSWDVETGVHTLLPSVQQAVFYLPDGQRAIVVVSQGKWPKQTYVPEMRDLNSGRVLHRFDPVDTSIGMSLSGDGKRLALMQNGQLSVYSTHTFERVAHITDVEGAMMVNLSHDGRRAVAEVLRCVILLSNGSEKQLSCPSPSLTVWDLDNGKRLLRTPNGSGDGWRFTRDGEYLTGPDTRLVQYIIRIRDGAELRFGSRIRSISPDTRRVVFDGALGLEIGALDEKSPVPALVRAPRVIARSADGRLRAGIASDGRLRIESATSCVRLGVTTAQWRQALDPLDHLDLGDDQVIFSPDGTSLFTVLSASSMHAKFRAYDTNTGIERWSTRAEGRNSGSAYVLPEAGHVLFQANNHPDVIRFRADTGASIHKGSMPRLGYALSITGAMHEVRDPNGDRAGNLYRPVAGKDGSRVAMSTFIGSKCFLSIWDLRNPRAVEDRPTGCLTRHKALSPDEKWLAASEEGNNVRIFAWRDHSSSLVSTGHTGRVTSIVFSPSSNRVASAAEDGTIVWADPKDGSIKGRARLPLDYAQRLWISADGRDLVADTARGLQVRFRIGASAPPQ